MMDDENAKPRLTLVTPMYNEGDGIRASLETILKGMEELEVNWEYILVDDGSTDDSYSKARQILDPRLNCQIVHYPHNRGRGYALRQGFSAARGEFIITTESDLTWGAEIIIKIYSELINTGNDIVIASVFAPGGGFANVPWFRRLISSMGNLIMRLCFDSNLTQFSGMTRGYRRSAIQSMFLNENGKEIHLEIIAKAEALGLQISEVPATIRWTQDRGAGSLFKKLSILRYVGSHLLGSFNQGAFKILLFFGGTALLLGFGLALFGTLNKLYFITSSPLPNLVNYGLVFILMGLGFLLFAGVSAQLGFMAKNIIHLQSQLKSLIQRELEKAGEDENNKEQ